MNHSDTSPVSDSTPETPVWASLLLFQIGKQGAYEPDFFSGIALLMVYLYNNHMGKTITGATSFYFFNCLCIVPARKDLSWPRVTLWSRWKVLPVLVTLDIEAQI
jgi:hypothetical protein